MTAVHINGEEGKLAIAHSMVESERTPFHQMAQGEGLRVRGAWTQADTLVDNVFKFPTNPLNTTCEFLSGKLLAISEGGQPAEIDPVSLETVDANPTAGLGLPLGFSAHGKWHPEAGCYYNHGLTMPPRVGITAFKLSKDMRVLAKKHLPFWLDGGLPFVHDSFLSRRFMAFLVPPWRLPVPKLVPVMAGSQSFGHSFEWLPHGSGRLIVLRTSDLSVVVDRSIAGNFSQHHHVGAREEQNESDEPLLRLRTLVQNGTREELEGVFSDLFGREFEHRHLNRTHDLVVNLATGAVSDFVPVLPESACEAPSEFPVVHTAWRLEVPDAFILTCLSRREHGFFDSIQVVDVSRARAEVHPLPDGLHLTETTFLPRFAATLPFGLLLKSLMLPITQLLFQLFVLGYRHFRTFFFFLFQG